MSFKVGILGAGSFGTAICNLIGQNKEVLLYARRQSVVDEINNQNSIKGFALPKSISATTNIQEVGEQCRLIFPIIPSEFLRPVIQKISPYVGPGHIMIHGTKGLDVSSNYERAVTLQEIKNSVFTMSEVIQQETSVLRTGALAGPNLAKEILEGQPAATVIASEFDEVVKQGMEALSSKTFIVFGSRNLKGIELAGALKNVIAIASGLMNGLGFGKNMQALLITRGLREMIHISKAVGAGLAAFLGTAGIGDLIATATSTNSRNFTFGMYLADGKTIDEIKAIMTEVAEGYRTLKFARKVVVANQLEAPMTEILYQVVYEGLPVRRAMIELVQNPLSVDVDFL